MIFSWQMNQFFNIVSLKIGQDYYRQIVGIPQGSVLSALLCSFFYGDLEREHLKFTKDQGSVCPFEICVLVARLMRYRCY